MGQYYRPVIVTENKTHIFKNWLRTIDGTSDYQGAKITEHSWIGNHWVDSVLSRLYNKQARVMWVGDYTERKPVISADDTVTPISAVEYYNTSQAALARQGINATIHGSVKQRKTDYKWDDKFIVNLSRKEYLNMHEYILRSTSTATDWEGWCIHPLPLLTSTGGDQGGGDYHSSFIDAYYVGRWAFDLITVTKVEPDTNEYTKLNVTFDETREVPISGVV